MENVLADKTFCVWAKVPGTLRRGAAGLRDAVVWPTHEWREVEMQVVRRCGLERGFMAQVVGITVCRESRRLSGLLVRERLASNYQAMREIELGRIRGLRDLLYDRLMVGSHESIDRSLVRSMGEAAALGFGASRRCWVDELARLVSRRRLSCHLVLDWLEDIEEGILLEDPDFTRHLRVA